MRQNLAQGRVGVTLLKFAGPFLLASLLQALYGAADLFVVGRFADAAAVSGVSIGSQIMQTLTGVILGLSMGGTVLIGQRVGEGDDPGAARAVGTMGVLFTAAALVLTPLMLLLTDGAVALLDTPAQAVEDTREYLLICSCGIPFIIGYNAVGGIFRGLGDSRTPLYFVALACGINIALDFLLTGALGWGAAGAAAATVAAQAVSFVTALLYLVRRGLPFSFRKEGASPWRPGKREMAAILKVGFPLALQDALVNISFLIITAVINAMGLVASAAVGVVEKLLVFAFLPLTAFSSAVAAMTAQNIGAGRRDRAVRHRLVAAFRRFVLPLRAVFPRHPDPSVHQRGGGDRGGGGLSPLLFHRLRGGGGGFLHERLFQRLRPGGYLTGSQPDRHLRGADPAVLCFEPAAGRLLVSHRFCRAHRHRRVPGDLSGVFFLGKPEKEERRVAGGILLSHVRRRSGV